MGGSLLILTQYYPPEMGAPQARLSELVTELVLLGWSVEILTCMPNYPTGKIFDNWRGKLVGSETIDGIKICRTWIWPSKSKKILPRMISYLSFVFSSLIFGRKMVKRPDIIWVEMPPLFLGFSGYGLSRFLNAKLVCNVSDLWPESFVHMNVMSRNSFAYKILEKFELWLYGQSIATTGQSREIVESIARRSPEIPVKLITNGVNPEGFNRDRFRNEDFRAGRGWVNKCVFIYAGLHGMAQGLDQIIELARRVRGKKDIHFCFVGDGPVKSDLVRTAESYDLTNVEFMPPCSKGDVVRLLANADVALITLVTAMVGAVPSKIYEAMAASLPILLIAEGEPKDRVLASDAGLVAACGDFDTAMELALRLADNPDMRRKLGANGRAAAETLYNRKDIALNLSSFFTSLI